MSYLLDTHAFLWFVVEDPKLSTRQRNFVESADGVVILSPASYWEIAIKISCGNYSLASSFELFWREALENGEIVILPIDIVHTQRVSTLPFHRRDPFDRMLVAQALSEDLTLISSDTRLDAYGVRRLW